MKEFAYCLSVGYTFAGMWGFFIAFKYTKTL